MENHIKITHQQLIAYLYGRIDRETQEQIDKIKKEDPGYHLFFELIDKLKPYADIRKQAPTASSAFLTFSEIEEMLMRFFSGEFKSNEVQQIVDALIASPVFYRRLLAKIALATPQITLEELPEMAEVRIKSNDEILKEIMVNAKKPEVKAPDIQASIDRLLSSMTNIGNNLKKLFEPPIRLPRYAFVIPVAIIAIIFSLLFYKNIIKKDSYDYYVYDSKVPYGYDTSSLRGAPIDFEDDSLFHSFDHRFKIGIGDYLTYDYTRAIRTFESLEPAALTLQAKTESQEFIQWIRDLYFYLGLSHLALSRTQRLDLNQEIRAQHINDAIGYISQADSLVQVYNLEGGDRENYFLGLAYWLGGRKDLAFIKLKKINPNSEFYEESNQLIKK